MSRSLALVPLVLIATALFGAADAEALSCQRRIVTRGDTMAKVTALCGDPVSRIERDVLRSRTVSYIAPGGTPVYDTVAATVQISTWVYDFGPLRLMQELTFEDGTLIRLRTLGRGNRTTAIDRAPTDLRLAAGPAWVRRRV